MLFSYRELKRDLLCVCMCVCKKETLCVCVRAKLNANRDGKFYKNKHTNFRKDRGGGKGHKYTRQRNGVVTNYT